MKGTERLKALPKGRVGRMDPLDFRLKDIVNQGGSLDGYGWGLLVIDVRFPFIYLCVDILNGINISPL